MKKMYLAIFLIILIVVVFAGCISFSNPIELTTISHEDEYNGQQGDNQNQLPVGNGEDSTDTGVSGNGTETQPSGSESTTAQGGNSVENIQAPASNEYDILKSGSFYMKGSLVDSTGTSSPMEIALTPNSVYMLSNFSGATMGLLISNDVMYMIYTDKSAYLELSDSIMSMAGFDMDELMGSEQINFGSYGNLTEADSVTEEDYNGRTCQVYHFTKENGGETRIYMDNAELIRIATYTSSGKLNNSTEIESISGTVPADKSAPPANYKHYKGVTGLFSFMTLLEDVVQ